jgi:hypothetical protein
MVTEAVVVKGRGVVKEEVGWGMVVVLGVEEVVGKEGAGAQGAEVRVERVVGMVVAC